MTVPVLCKWPHRFVSASTCLSSTVLSYVCRSYYGPDVESPMTRPRCGCPFGSEDAMGHGLTARLPGLKRGELSVNECGTKTSRLDIPAGRQGRRHVRCPARISPAEIVERSAWLSCGETIADSRCGCLAWSLMLAPDGETVVRPSIRRSPSPPADEIPPSDRTRLRPHLQ